MSPEAVRAREEEYERKREHQRQLAEFDREYKRISKENDLRDQRKPLFWLGVGLFVGGNLALAIPAVRVSNSAGAMGSVIFAGFIMSFLTWPDVMRGIEPLPVRPRDPAK